MIEVERKFRPTPEQLSGILADAEFLGEKILEDNLYDYPDYRLIKSDVRLRNRNGNFELKIGDEGTFGVSEEIEEERGIKNYFKTDKSIPQFVEENLVKILEYKNTRKKYRLGEFTIDLDDMDFGYNCLEIELLVADKSEIENANKKIIELAQKYHLNMDKVPTKRSEYFRIVKPEVFKLLYPNG
jgi:adenylate cyclase class IV